MTIIEAIILGIVQGFTEFLPVSSSGHLIVAERILGIQSDSLAFGLLMHLATLCAVVFFYRKKLLPLVRQPFSKPVGLIVAATIPTVIIVFAFGSVFRAAFEGGYLVYCFLITAILLMVSSRAKLTKKPLKAAAMRHKWTDKGVVAFSASQNGKSLCASQNGKSLWACQNGISYLDALIIGITQGFAALPGISRSGSTISVSMLLGNDKKTSADFSFIISIPIILGSATLELLGSNPFSSVQFLPLLAGFVSAFVSGFLALSLLTRIIKNSSLDSFAIYLMALAVFLLINDNLLFLF